jgi:hypothetical protein
VERTRNTEVGWSPAQGSYEEAVLSWHEQIDQSFRRRYLESQRTGPESHVRSEMTIRSTGAVAD